MGRNLSPKCKLCRREGEKLFLKGERCQSAKCAIVKRNYPPGCHGAKGKGRLSNYGTQLRAKQKAKRLYSLTEKQLRSYFSKATASKEDVGTKLLSLLETRLDNVVYRMGLALSRVQARQIVGHGFISVNGKKVNIASFQVKAGDVISLKESKKKRKLYQTMFASLKRDIKKFPSWMSFDSEKNSAKILNAPNKTDFVENINDKLIIEFYSK